MKTIKNPREMQAYCARIKRRGKTIGLVPTMGCLHAGHLSLIQAAKKKADHVIVSIFINPTQFGPGEDLAAYPKTIKQDKKMIKSLMVDTLFLPNASSMFAQDHSAYINIEGLAQKMCGQSRPTHFRGVATVVAKLFTLISPDYAFFGEKDFQQQVIIKKMAKDLNYPVEIISLPTIREPNGLAMSSRNKYLSAKEKARATVLYQALCLAQQEIKNGERNADKVLRRMRSLITATPGIRIDYTVIVDAQTLEKTKKIKGKVLVALAVFLGKARLIDNMVIEEK